MTNERAQALACGERLTDPPPPAPPIIATRATMHEAKRHFEAGGAVLVSEYGHEPTQTVTASTTTHDRTRTTWDDLAETVNMWRNRYPNQRFYIIPRPDNEGTGCTCSTDEDACPDHPGDPCPKPLQLVQFSPADALAAQLAPQVLAESAEQMYAEEVADEVAE